MDMLVHLLDLPAEDPGLTALAQAGIRPWPRTSCGWWTG